MLRVADFTHIKPDWAEARGKPAGKTVPRVSQLREGCSPGSDVSLRALGLQVPEAQLRLAQADAGYCWFTPPSAPAGTLTPGTVHLQSPLVVQLVLQLHPPRSAWPLDKDAEQR